MYERKIERSVHLIENKPQTGPQNVKNNIIFAKKVLKYL